MVFGSCDEVCVMKCGMRSEQHIRWWNKDVNETISREKDERKTMYLE